MLLCLILMCCKVYFTLLEFELFEHKIHNNNTRSVTKINFTLILKTKQTKAILTSPSVEDCGTVTF